MKIDGRTPCPYCNKITFSTTYLNDNGESYVECYQDEGGCGRPYVVVYIQRNKAESRKLTEQERRDIKYIYDWYKDLNMDE